MIVRVEDTRHEGRAVDLAGHDPERVAAAVAGEESVAAGETDLHVEAPDPGAVVRRVSPATPATAVSVGPLLAAVGRSRGLSAPQDERIAAVREELSALDPEAVDGRPARRRAATVGDREAALRERVAELRGRLSAHREAGEAPPDLQERLRDAVRELTEVRTERVAAEQELDRTERRAREIRDERERRLELEDERDNLRRAAREHFLDRLGEAFHGALRAVPGPDPSGDTAEFNPRSVADDPTAALAAVRLAECTGPVVVACGRFESAAAAARTLEAPVIRVVSG